MELKIRVDDRDTLNRLAQLSPRQFMIAWTTAVRQYVQRQAQEKIGGSFGGKIARQSILTDDRNELRHEIYLGGENGYIAEHIHTGGIIRPKERRYLAVPIDRSVKGIRPRKYPGELVLVRKKEDGPHGRAYLAKPLKTRIKPLWVLMRQVTQKPRPWWPDDNAVAAETARFFEEAF